MNNFQLIEALLYIRGSDGISPADFRVALGDESVNTAAARQQLRDFQRVWNGQMHGLSVVEFNDAFKLATREEWNDAITRLVTTEKKQRLSQAAIETAGIIAYKQPISKSQVNDIRGVASEAVVNTLLIKGLIEEKGIAQTVGHPVLYGITNKFYDYFQFQSLKELPELSEFIEQEVEEGFELFGSQREE